MEDTLFIFAEKEIQIFRGNGVVDLYVFLRTSFWLIGDVIHPLRKFKIFGRKKLTLIFSLQGTLTTASFC